jgi:selenide,water dikinase
VVSTVDYITPPVDEPIWFGRIAAANALSDIYAMGGRPITALNLVMYPEKKLGSDVLREILKGGHEKVTEAGASLAGGHSTDSEEPVYGLAVTGVVSPKRILANHGALPGDVLILTKPLGTGVLFNACRSGRLPRAELDPVLPQVAFLLRFQSKLGIKSNSNDVREILNGLSKGWRDVSTKLPDAAISSSVFVQLKEMLNRWFHKGKKYTIEY